MKFRLFDRILLGLYALMGIALLAYAAFCLPSSQIAEDITARTTIHIVDGTWFQIALICAAVLLAAWSLWLLALAFRHEPRGDKGSVSLQNTENGTVRVSVGAMDALVKQAISQTKGVADIKTRIVNHEDSITVKLDMSMFSDARIPNVTMLMQRGIKSFIEEYSGIAVREVEIMISTIEPTAALPSGKQPGVIVVPTTESIPEPKAEREEAPAEPEPIRGDEPSAEPEISLEDEVAEAVMEPRSEESEQTEQTEKESDRQDG